MGRLKLLQLIRTPEFNRRTTRRDREAWSEHRCHGLYWNRNKQGARPLALGIEPHAQSRIRVLVQRILQERSQSQWDLQWHESRRARHRAAVSCITRGSITDNSRVPPPRTNFLQSDHSQEPPLRFAEALLLDARSRRPK